MKNQKGITLVALVVTIVVLLILAAITITYVLADDGIFGKAQEAAQATEMQELEEHVKLALINAKTELVLYGTGVAADDTTLANDAFEAAMPTSGSGNFGDTTGNFSVTKNTSTGKYTLSGTATVVYKTVSYTVTSTDFANVTITPAS